MVPACDKRLPERLGLGRVALTVATGLVSPFNTRRPLELAHFSVRSNDLFPELSTGVSLLS